MLSIRKKFNIHVVSAIYAITLIAILNPFFIWDGYCNGMFSRNVPVLKLLYIVTVLLGAIYIMNISKIPFDRIYLAMTLMFCLVVLEFICGGKFNNVKSIGIVSILNIIMIGMFCLFPDSLKYRIYQYFRFLFVISIIPGILYSLLTFIGVKVNFELLNAASEIKQNSNVIYLHFPLAVQITKTYDLIGNINRFRLCGIYDEPGRVGTICALFLTAEDLRINKDWKNRFLFVGGVLSLSVAFFIILTFVFIFKLIKNRKIKYLLLLTIIVGIFFVFSQIEFNNVALSALQKRLVINSNGLAGNNRTNAEFEKFFGAFLKNSNIYRLLFGYGDGAAYAYCSMHNLGSSSYKCIIYDLGFIGSFFYILWIILYGIVYSKNKSIRWLTVINVLIFLINLYQRPTIFNPSYLLIPLAGIAARNFEINNHIGG